MIPYCTRLIAIGAVVALATLGLGSTPAFAQSVSADPTEYRPGNIVTILGTGWQSGEAVSMVIHEEPTLNPDASLTATADANGYFLNEGFTVPDNSTGTTRYTVTASGSSGLTVQAVFTDPPPPPPAAVGSLCANVTSHGGSVCNTLTNNPAGVLGTGQTHYAQVVGSMADYQIIWATGETLNYVTEASTATVCPSGVKVQIKSSLQGNTVVCGTPSGNIVSFSWTAPTTACQTTVVAYKTGTTGGGQDQFTNTNNDIIKDDADDNNQTGVAGIGYVASSTPPLTAKSCANVTTEIHDSTETTITTATPGVTVHDKATVTGTTLGGTPTGTATFTFFGDGTCTTPFTNGSGNAGTVALDGTGVAHPSSSFGPLVAGSYSFKAHYNPGTGSLYDPADSLCEMLMVVEELPQTGNLTACKYEDKNANGQRDLPGDGPLNGWFMTINPLNQAPEPQTQTTDSSGCVTWTNLTPGSYMVTEAPPSGTPWFNTDPGVPAGTLCLIGATSSVGIPMCTAAPSKSDTVTSGNTTTVYFGNLQSAEKHGQKFYDGNANGTNDDSQGVSGWNITLTGTDLLGNSVGPVLTTTNSSGNYAFVGLLPGTYTVTEGTPTQTSWMHTTATFINFTLTAGEVEEHNDFGNLCLGAGGGLTLGFWTNKNGQALITGGQLCTLNDLNLRNATGGNFNPVAGCPSPTTAQITAGKTLLKNWLLNATATNMAYMLSAQLATMELNVLNSFVNGSSLVFAGTAPAGCTVPNLNTLGYISISNLMTDADTASNHSLFTNSNTTAAGDARSCQEFMKNALDRANNNLNFVQPTPATCPVPTFP